MSNPDRKSLTVNNLSRRDFLKLGIGAALGAALGGCAPEQGLDQEEATATKEPINKEASATATSQPTPIPTETSTQTPTPTETPVASYLEQEGFSIISNTEETLRFRKDIITFNFDILARTGGPEIPPEIDPVVLFENITQRFEINTPVNIKLEFDQAAQRYFYRLENGVLIDQMTEEPIEYEEGSYLFPFPNDIVPAETFARADLVAWSRSGANTMEQLKLEVVEQDTQQAEQEPSYQLLVVSQAGPPDWAWQEPEEVMTYPVDEEEIERLGLEVETPSAYTYVNQDIIARTLIEMNIKKLNANEPKILLVSAPTLKREIDNLIKENPDISVEKIIQYLEQDIIQLSPEEKEQFISQLQIIEAFCQQNLDPESTPASADSEKWQEAIQSALEHSNYINLELYQNAAWDEQLDTLLLKPEKEGLPDIAHLFESMVYIQRITVPGQYVDNKPLELIHATDVAEEGYVDFSQADLQVVSRIFKAGRDWLKRALIRPDHQDFPTNRVVLGVLNGVGEVAEYDEQSLFIPIRNLPGSGSLRMHPVKNQAGEIAYAQGGLDWPYDHEKIAKNHEQTFLYLVMVFLHSTANPRQSEYNPQVTEFRNASRDMSREIRARVPGVLDQNSANLQFIPMK